MEYEIIATGSKGNAVRIDDILVDAGIPYTRLKPHLYKVKYLLYTHIHGDHFKPATFKKIIKEFPNIEIIAGLDIAYEVGISNLTKVVTKDSTFKLGEYTITTFDCVHDVECLGYVIQKGDINIIYATDCSTLGNAPKLKYDYLFIESNHCEHKLQQYANNNKNYGYDVIAGAKRHLSTQQSKEFYFVNRRNKESKWIELHQSERFY